MKPDEYGVTPPMLGYCGEVMTVKSTYSILSAYYLVEDNAEFIWHEDTLEPADSKTLRMADGTIIGEFNTGGFCDGFRGGKKPEYVLNEKQAKEYAENIIATSELISCITGIPYENSINKLKTCLSAFPNDGISAKNGGKNSMKFTFYVTEGTRPDKSCNGTIPTMTTTVTNGLDEASVTCDKVDFNERQGVLEGIAQLYCKGRFDKEYEAAVKLNKRNDKANRTCVYCRKIFGTAEERVEHEAWHVECRKARHERYLLRKRAKEIAFEEQAQKMAKEMMGEQK